MIRHTQKPEKFYRTACFGGDQWKEKRFVILVFVGNLGTTIASANHIVCATGLLITRNSRHSAASTTMLLDRSTKNQPFVFRQPSRDFAALFGAASRSSTIS
jgi:hypothetical protein